jgi:hypothetical protein
MELMDIETRAATQQEKESPAIAESAPAKSRRPQRNVPKINYRIGNYASLSNEI